MTNYSLTYQPTNPKHWLNFRSVNFFYVAGSDGAVHIRPNTSKGNAVQTTLAQRRTSLEMFENNFKTGLVKSMTTTQQPIW